MTKHIKTLQAMRSVFEGIPAPCDERAALDAAIASLTMASAPAGPGEVDTFIEQMDMLVEDFYRYQEGHKDYPFAVVREAVIAALNEYQEKRAALLRKLQQGADYVVVPREPTAAMCAAIVKEVSAQENKWMYDPGAIYAAMIAASQDQEGGHGNR